MAEQDSRSRAWFRRGVKITLVAVAAAIFYLGWPEKVVPVRTVSVAIGEVEDVTSSIQAGVVAAARDTNIRAVTVGRVARLHVARGDRVEKDQPLVELENAGLKARLRLARANLEAGRSTLRSAVLRRDAARNSLERTRKLVAKGAAPRLALDRVQAEHDLAGEAVATAEAGVSQLQASLELALAALEESRIRAPFAGLVTQVHIEEGEVLMAGAPVLDLVDDSRVTVRAAVDEADAGRLRPGMPVRLESEAFPSSSFRGSLEWIAPVVRKDMAQNRHLEVEVGLDGAASRLKVGMSVDVDIIVERKEQTLYVPTNAVMRSGEQAQVYVVQGGRARLETIRTGLVNWERTEVLSGLRSGEKVIVSLGEKGLDDGVRVRLQAAPGSGQVAY